MNVAVLIPHRPIDEDREANLACTRVQYERLGWPVHVCDSDTEQFSRSNALNEAARTADADVFFIADNDILLGREQQLLDAASVAFNDGCYVVAFSRLRVLDWNETRLVRDGADPFSQPHIETISLIWCNAIAVPRSLFETVKGFDERLAGYGAQDIAFMVSCSTLGNTKQRVVGDAFHLRHFAPDKSRDGEFAKYALGGRYVAADGDKEAMRALVAER